MKHFKNITHLYYTLLQKREAFFKRFIVFFCLLPYLSFGQINSKRDYVRLIDSADVYVDSDFALAEKFLDSIPKPLNLHIEGKLGDYHYLRGIISNNNNNNQSKLFQDFILASSYAVKEENFLLAGSVYSELFSNIYFVSKDSTAFKYLYKSEYYYKKANDSIGLIEIKQMPAYIEYVNKNYRISNQLMLDNLEEYKNFHNDKYYYMFACFVLATNHLALDEPDQAHFYINNFKSIKNDPTIIDKDYLGLESGIEQSQVNYFFKIKNIDSIIHYLNKVKQKHSYLNYNNMQDYYQQNADFYKYIGDSDNYIKYVDSLLLFENELLIKNLNTGLVMNDIIENNQTQLTSETEKKILNRVLVFILLIVILIFVFVFVRYYKKIKLKLDSSTNKNEKFDYINNNNQKLTAKLDSLESYIGEVKSDLKLISSNSDVNKQNEKVKDLYKKIHIDSPVSMDSQQDYLKLVNDSNADFFMKIKNDHPNLIDSEIIICYYLKVGFKNKDIAQFLKTSVRAIESKRYRIEKKILIEGENKIPLIEYLNSLDTISEPSL